MNGNHFDIHPLSFHSNVFPGSETVNGPDLSYPLVFAGEGEVVKVVAMHGGHKLRARLLCMGITLGDELQVVHKQANGAMLIEKSGCRYGLGGGMAHKINVIKV
jgi:Fe2+ transport system protein FeoA